MKKLRINVSLFCDIQRDNLTIYFNQLGIQSFKYGQTFIFLRSVYNVHELHELFLYLPCVCSNRPTSLCFKNVFLQRHGLLQK